MIAGTLVACFMKEPPRDGCYGDTHYLTHFRSAYHELKKNPTLRYTFIYSALGMGVLGEMEEYDLLYYRLVGIPFCFIGLLGPANSAASFWRSHCGWRMLKTRL